MQIMTLVRRALAAVALVSAALAPTAAPALAVAPSSAPALAVAPSPAAALSGGAARASAGDARVIGTFAMVAKVTTAVQVRGEHAGQTLRRTWVIRPSECNGSVCRRLTLWRERGSGFVERVALQQTGRGRYAGSGTFYVPLRCLGRTYRLGSRVPFRITLTVTAAVRVQAIQFARRIEATYVNPARSDDTPCPLGPSHDAALYTGTLSSPAPSPSPPTASFSAQVDATDETVDFKDTSQPGAGGAAIQTHKWRFDDPVSGASDTSTQADPVHRFAASGSYLVSLTVTDANELSSTRTQIVTVPPPPPRPEPVLPAAVMRPA